MFAVKSTTTLNNKSLVRYIGRRGESKNDIRKIEGWKRLSTAEEFLKGKNMVDNSEINGMVFTHTYEIIQY